MTLRYIMTPEKLLTVFGVITAIALAALSVSAPKLLAAIFDPAPVPSWCWKAITGVSGIILMVSLVLMVGLSFWPSKTEEILHNVATGGRGGNAKVTGNNAVAIGGRGGEGGVGEGKGGTGGSAEVVGDNAIAVGGDGGNAGQPDGRGGRRAISPAQRIGSSTDMWKYGCGGRGANAPEYDRRLSVLTEIRSEYMAMFPDDVIFIQAGIDPVPTDWVNARLREKGEGWRIGVDIIDGGYVMPSLEER
ncbi:hypothetical protein [Pseudodesulfovibrio karagichevae]|uniref:Uncharacterized protein n=1 Tax=Pseudodesulfovibrio karagichevae TaxID=3239305 RepID=A0ABV4JXD3_9BACT